MFDQTFIDGTQKTRKKFTVVASLAIQTAVVCILVLIPLVYTEALPNAQLKSLLIAPPPPRSPAPQHAKPQTVRPVPVITRALDARILVAPSVIPKRVNQVQDSASAPDIGVAGGSGDPNSVGNGVPYGVPGSLPSTAPPPLPSPATKPKITGAVRVGGIVAEANLIRRVQPVYPPLAKSARVSGSVEFTATISKEGAIENLQLIRGHPLLVSAAREAVLQWRYRPTMLNGQPVEVVTDITVNFILSQ